MWHVIASGSNRNPQQPPIKWDGIGYGEMQKSMNELYDVGYRIFSVWEEPNVSE